VATLIKLPSVAADTDGGTLHQWLKQEGDSVAVGDALAEIETEKAIVEINAEQAGVLGRIVVQAGAASVPINTVIGVLLAPGEGAADIDRALAESGAAAGGAGTPAQASEAAKAGASTGASTSAAAAPVVETAAASASSSVGRTSAVASTAARSATPGARVFASPLARRLTESKQHVPHFYLTLDCRMDALLALRSQANHGGTVKLSVNDFIVRAAALALREVPEVNVSWHDDAVEFHAGADVSVAVATDGGLVTPIVRDADVKSLSAIATEIVELAGRAKINRLKPEEFTGGSLTVSNLGMYGIKQFAAIINPPQAAILAVGAAERRPIVTESGDLAAATVMTVTLSADHRAVDGAVGARWLAAFKSLIENPVRILL